MQHSIFGQIRRLADGPWAWDCLLSRELTYDACCKNVFNPSSFARMGRHGVVSGDSEQTRFVFPALYSPRLRGFCRAGQELPRLCRTLSCYFSDTGFDRGRRSDSLSLLDFIEITLKSQLAMHNGILLSWREKVTLNTGNSSDGGMARTSIKTIYILHPW